MILRSARRIFHIIAGTGWDRFGVLFKLHHAFGDGMGALEIGLRVLDEVTLGGRDARRRSEVANGTSPDTGSSALSRLWQAGDARGVEGVLGQLGEATSIAASMR